MNKIKSTEIFVDLDRNIKKIKTDSIVEQEFVNYMTVPSLESAATAKIIAQLWTHADFREEILNHLEFCNSLYFNSSLGDKKFLQILKNISKYVDLLPLPNALKENARRVIRPIGLEIMNWIASLRSHCWYANSKSEHIDSICWTTRGTIEKVKTLQLLFVHSNPEEIFNKACEYCLEDHIANLWEQIQKRKKENYFYSEFIYQDYENHLIAYWICFTSNELHKLMSRIKPNDSKLNMYDCNHSIYKNMFTLSVSNCKGLAVKYFWNKLTDEEKNNNIIKWTCLSIERGNARNTEYTDVMCFLLTQMNDKEQQREVFQKYSAQILNALFLGYPFQRFLLPTIQLMWDYLDSRVYIGFLIRVIEENEKTELPATHFRKLWRCSPIKFKKQFITHIISCYKGIISALWNLFLIQDVETIELILSDADVVEKKDIVFSAIRSEKLFRLIYKERLALLEILIKESMIAQCEIKKIKEDILLQLGDTLCCNWICDENFQAVDKFLLWGFSSEDEVHTFKANIASRIVNERQLGILGYGKWSSFEWFIDWCFYSVEQINKFKMGISAFEKMESFIFEIIVYGYNFEFAEKFLVWCFTSENEIREFKKQLMISCKGIDMFTRFLSEYKVYDSKYSYWELVKMLAEWFHPFEKDTLIEFKEAFKDEYLSFNGLCESTDDLDQLFYVLDSLIHGFHERDWFPGSSGCCFDVDRVDVGSDTSGDFPDTSGSSQCCTSSSDKSDDCVNLLLTDELLDDDSDDGDYNGDIIMLIGEILQKLDDAQDFDNDGGDFTSDCEF